MERLTFATMLAYARYFKRRGYDTPTRRMLMTTLVFGTRYYYEI